MTQVTTAERPDRSAPSSPLTASGMAAAMSRELAGEPSEEPDSPGPTSPTSASDRRPSVDPGGPDSSSPFSTGPSRAGDPRAGDPLAEPMAALLGSALAVVALLVPLASVLSDRRDAAPLGQGAEPATRMLRSERIDDRPASRRSAPP